MEGDLNLTKVVRVAEAVAVLFVLYVFVVRRLLEWLDCAVRQFLLRGTRDSVAYTIEGKPYAEGVLDREITAELDRVLERGSPVHFLTADRKSLVRGELKVNGFSVGTLWFYPEGLGLMNPEEFVAKLSGTDRVETFTEGRKLIVSGGKYSLIFENPLKAKRRC